MVLFVMDDLFEFMTVTGTMKAKEKYEQWVKEKRAKWCIFFELNKLITKCSCSFITNIFFYHTHLYREDFSDIRTYSESVNSFHVYLELTKSKKGNISAVRYRYTSPCVISRWIDSFIKLLHIFSLCTARRGWSLFKHRILWSHCCLLWWFHI